MQTEIICPCCGRKLILEAGVVVTPAFDIDGEKAAKELGYEFGREVNDDIETRKY